MTERPGLVALFGSGETSASGRRIHYWVLGHLSPPIPTSPPHNQLKPGSDRFAPVLSGDS